MLASLVADRRRFLRTLAASAGVLAAPPLLSGCVPVSFEHGVASGDPGLDRVIIWTRATAVYEGRVLVHWEVSERANFRKLVAEGKTLTDASVDYTVKVDVEGLRPGKTYYYRFNAGGALSPVGKARTLPKGHVGSLRLAVMSCSNYPAGYFHVYRLVAENAANIDFVLHLGDYIYEYGRDGYASEDAEALGRDVVPEGEIVSLSDYRERYALYRRDRDLQYAHRNVPFIVVWDDHEIANNAWQNGAENHQPDEGTFAERKANALQAYYEWMPIRETQSTPRDEIYRSFRFGDLLTLHMLDTRVVGRDEQLDYASFYLPDGTFDDASFAAELGSATRSLLGEDQANWLKASLSESTSTWDVLGQQVLMSSLSLPAPLALQQISLVEYQSLLIKAQTNPSELSPSEVALLTAPSVPINLDAWDGYPAAREQVLQTAVTLGKNLISLAGDTHNAWASDLDTLDGVAAGVEFATPSVSSPGFEEYLSDIPPDALAEAFVHFVGPLKYAETAHRGYLVLRLSHTEALAEWIFIDGVKSSEFTVLTERTKRLKVLAGAGQRRLLDI